MHEFSHNMGRGALAILPSVVQAFYTNSCCRGRRCMLCWAGIQPPCKVIIHCDAPLLPFSTVFCILIWCCVDVARSAVLLTAVPESLWFFHRQNLEFKFPLPLSSLSCCLSTSVFSGRRIYEGGYCYVHGSDDSNFNRFLEGLECGVTDISLLGSMGSEWDVSFVISM